MAKKKIKSSSIFEVKLYIALVTVVIFLIAFFLYGYLNAGIKYTPSSTMYQNISDQNPPHLPISNHQPNKLVVTRPKDSPMHLSALTIIVTNPTLVKEIFDDILQLPLFGNEKCPEESGYEAVYTLTFYQDNKLTDTSIYRTTGCRPISIDNYPARRDYNGWFDRDFQKATGLSGQALYGYKQQ